MKGKMVINASPIILLLRTLGTGSILILKSILNWEDRREVCEPLRSNP